MRKRLVILDVMMPDMDGMEVLRRIHSDPRTAQLPVVMFSAIEDAAYAGYAITMGASDFWVKGRINYSKLHEMVAPYIALPAINSIFEVHAAAIATKSA